MSRRSAVLLAVGTAAAAAAIAVPLLLVAGGERHLTKREFASRVTSILTTLAADFRHAGSGSTQKRTSASLTATKSALDRAAARLGPIRPPADARDEQRALVDELRDYAAQVDLVRASVDFGDVATIVAHLRDVTAPAAINRTIRTLRAKGYPIPVRVASIGDLRRAPG